MLAGSRFAHLAVAAALSGGLAASVAATSAGAPRGTAASRAPAGAATLARGARAASSQADDSCDTRKTSGTTCQPGNGLKSAGGGEKVSHAGWPAVTGLLWKSETAGSRTYTGTALNDELLSHHASDTINGRAGNDIIWGDWDPDNNTTHQSDVLNGDAGNDFIYASHGHNTIRGGAGKDYIYAYYGHGSIDCGPGQHDTAKVHLEGNPYTVKNCERLLNFCAFGSIDNKHCAKPGEKKAARSTR